MTGLEPVNFRSTQAQSRDHTNKKMHSFRLTTMAVVIRSVITHYTMMDNTGHAL